MNWPGEHGFRFFPSFYKHVTDTMKRIPYTGNAHGVFDNIVPGTRAQIARDGKMSIIACAKYPVTLDDWVTTLKALVNGAELGIPDQPTQRLKLTGGFAIADGAARAKLQEGIEIGKGLLRIACRRRSDGAEVFQCRFGGLRGAAGWTGGRRGG